MLLAHGVGRVYESPLPIWLYLVGAGATVLISFLIAARAHAREAARERVVAGGRAASLLLGGARIVALALLGVLILFGVLRPERGLTVATLLFWVGLIVGTTIACSLVAGLWERVNPWATIEDTYRTSSDHAESSAAPPPWLGPLLLYGLFWFELVSNQGFDGLVVAIVVVAYSIYVLTLRARFGEGAAAADPLAILFGFAARAAPLRVDEDGIYYRGWGRRTEEAAPMPWPLFVCVFILLASTTLDNLRETVQWNDFLAATALGALDAQVVDTTALLLLILPFAVPFALAAAAPMGDDVRIGWIGRARHFGWSLIPIGIAYVLAHNMPLFMIGIPLLLNQLVEPLGIEAFHDYAPSPQLVWFLEIVLIVGGHVLGVLAAHRTALRLSGSRAHAARSQVALTVLMTGFTVATLWLLSLPLVTTA